MKLWLNFIIFVIFKKIQIKKQQQRRSIHTIQVLQNYHVRFEIRIIAIFMINEQSYYWSSLYFFN